MKGQNLTVGMDLGDRHHHVCVLDKAGEIVGQEVIVNTREVEAGGVAGKSRT